ncbi:unknown [Corallococcus sp. CAG:1435]|nr:unknown [Corallococcus sp. CAG:1435]
MTKTLLLCVACFAMWASLTYATAKRCMPKSEKPIASEHHKNAVDAFGTDFFGKTSCRVLFKRTSDIFVIFATAQFCVKAFVLTTHAKQHNKFVQNFKKIRSVFTKLDFCSIICIRRSLETLPIPNKIYCKFVIGGVR